MNYDFLFSLLFFFFFLIFLFVMMGRKPGELNGNITHAEICDFMDR